MVAHAHAEPVHSASQPAEAERRMMRIAAPELAVPDGHMLNIFRKSGGTRPRNCGWQQSSLRRRPVADQPLLRFTLHLLEQEIQLSGDGVLIPSARPSAFAHAHGTSPPNAGAASERASASQCSGHLRRKVFVNLELHALSSSGSSTVPSLANPAAYARAALMSSASSEA